MQRFIVPSDNHEVRFGPVHDKIGERLANNAEIFYEDVFIPDEDLLGAENPGLSDVARLLRGSNAYAGDLHAGRRPHRLHPRYQAGEGRVQGGMPIVRAQRIAAQLGDMWARLDMARTYVYRAAWAADHADRFDPKMAATPKLVASQMAFDVTRAHWRCSAAPG